MVLENLLSCSLFSKNFVFAQAAGNAVKRASDNLVKAAQKAAFDKAEDDSVVVKTKFVGGIAQVRLLPMFPQYESVPLQQFLNIP